MTHEPPKKDDLGKYWLISIGLHVGIVLFFLVGGILPRSMPDTAPPPIYVELAPVAEKAMAPTEGKQIESQKKKEPEPVIDEKPKPKSALEQVLDTPKEEKKKEKEPEKDKEKKEKTKDAPSKEKPKKEEKKEEKAEDTKEKENVQESFDSVLKNLSDTPDDTKAGDQDIKAADKTDEPSGLPDFATQLTISEFDALRQQLARCWNIPAGALEADNLAIDLQVEVNQDRVAISAKVVDQIRYQTDSYFRAAADSAVRAVQAPECTPLELPPDKYNAWKSMIIGFNPKDMF